MKKDSVIRIIDANSNRALEGLRIIEEIARFALQDKKITRVLKEIRHKIKEEIESLFNGAHRLLMARDAIRDVGLSSYVKDEFRRSNLNEILTVNFKRTEEALRVLEEFTKLFDKKKGEIFKKLRFSIYSIEKDVLTKYRIPDFRYRLEGLYVIIDQSLRAESRPSAEIRPSGRGERTHFQIAEEVIAGGAKILQLREKRIADRNIMGIGKKIRGLTRDNNVVFIINDRPDLCLAIDADGVHLGQDDIPINLARSILGNEKIIGVSTHNFKQAIRAQNDGADYISIGPIFQTAIKPDLKPVGVNFIGEIKEKIKIPFFVIGGIKEGSLKSVLRAGARGVAVISAIMCAQDIRGTTRKFARLIDSHSVSDSLVAKTDS